MLRKREWQQQQQKSQNTGGYDGQSPAIGIPTFLFITKL